MTGVLAIRCNVQASCEARRRSLVGFGLFRGAYGAADGWRLEVAHVECGRTGLPKQIGGGENKVSARSAQALVLLHA